MLIRISKIMLIVFLLLVCFQGFGFAQDQLIIPIPGGTFAEAVHKYVIPPFEEKYGIRVLAEPSLSLQTLNKARAETDDPELMMVSFDEVYAIPAVNEGLLADIDHSRIPNLEESVDVARRNTDKYIIQFMAYETMIYNTDKVKDPPTTWDDLLDPKWKGKVIWPDISTSHGMGMLVLMARLNGGSETNIEPGFDFLKKLKPNVLTWWTNHDQVSRMLNLGEAWVSVWASDRALAQQNMGAPVMASAPEGGLYYWRNTAAIPINLPEEKRDSVYKWLNHYISEEMQKVLAENVLFIPVNKNVEIDLPSNIVYQMTSPEILDRFVDFDLGEIAKHQGEWTERFRREISD